MRKRVAPAGGGAAGATGMAQVAEGFEQQSVMVFVFLCHH
jgi:hypothetical protein